MEDLNPAQPISEADDIGPFRVVNAMEVAFVLRSLAQRGDFVTVYFNNGRDLLLTRILDADAKAGRFLFDLGGHEPSNQALQKVDKAVFVATPDGVKIQFSTANVKLASFEGKPCFVAPLPPDLVKLQRRDFFRLPTPIANPYSCHIQWPNGPNTKLELRDISLGGAGMWLPDSLHSRLEVGLKLERVSFDFGPAGLMYIDLVICNWHSITNRNGQTQYIMGTCFADLSRGQEASLQRLISQLERERKALLD